MEQRILLIEDNLDITRVVQYELEQAGYRVMTAPDGISGLTSARENIPDLVILDLGLPDFDGAEIARRLRKTSPVPIIILTAMDALDRKVNLLEAGADDYMTKPFHPEELVARVKVQLRHQQHGEVIMIGALEIHPQKRLCHYNGHEVRLSPKEFDLLTFWRGSRGGCTRAARSSARSGTANCPATATWLMCTWRTCGPSCATSTATASFAPCAASGTP